MPISCYQLVHYKSYHKCCSEKKIFENKAIFTAKKPEDMKEQVRSFFEKLNAKNVDFWVNSLIRPNWETTLPTWVFYWSADGYDVGSCKCREAFMLECVYEPRGEGLDSDDLHTVPRETIEKDPDAYAADLLEEFGVLYEGEDDVNGLSATCVDSDDDSDSDEDDDGDDDSECDSD